MSERTRPIRTPDCPECWGGEGNGHPLRMVPRDEGQNYELVCDTQGEEQKCGFSVIVLDGEDEQTAVDRQYASIQKIRSLVHKAHDNAAPYETRYGTARTNREYPTLEQSRDAWRESKSKTLGERMSTPDDTEVTPSPWTDPDTGFAMDAGDIRADVVAKLLWLAENTDRTWGALLLDLARDARTRSQEAK